MSSGSRLQNCRASTETPRSVSTCPGKATPIPLMTDRSLTSVISRRMIPFICSSSSEMWLLTSSWWILVLTRLLRSMITPVMPMTLVSMPMIRLFSRLMSNAVAERREPVSTRPVSLMIPRSSRSAEKVETAPQLSPVSSWILRLEMGPCLRMQLKTLSMFVLRIKSCLTVSVMLSSLIIQIHAAAAKQGEQSNYSTRPAENLVPFCFQKKGRQAEISSEISSPYRYRSDQYVSQRNESVICAGGFSGCQSRPPR